MFHKIIRTGDGVHTDVLVKNLPRENIPIYLLLMVDGDTVIFEGKYLGIIDEEHVFIIKSGGFCSPLAWAEFDSISIPEI